MLWMRPTAQIRWALVVAGVLSWSLAVPANRDLVASQSQTAQTESAPSGPPDFERLANEQAETDRAWRAAAQGVMQVEKIAYPSRVGDLDIPAFVFQPITTGAPRSHAALVWVHENIRGHLYERHIPFVREAVSRGYVVMAPEYRGSIGYGQALYDAIDYGGAEVDDIATATTVLRERYPHVNPSRIGVIGWSHGGLIALLAILREPPLFEAAVAVAPVTNLFHRLAFKGVDAQRRAIDPHNRFGGTPAERPEVYRERSPLFHVDKLAIPLLVHVAANDEDVTIDESRQLVDALVARKAHLADVKIYEAPKGGHLFDRLVDPIGDAPENTPEQVDAWQRIWSFLGRHLSPLDVPAVPASAR